MHITIYKSVHSPAQPQHQITATWPEIAENLLEFNHTLTKEKNSLFNFWELKRLPEAEQGGYNPIDPKTGEKIPEVWHVIPNTIRRCKNNAIGLHALVLDYDKDKTIAEVEAMLHGMEYVIYTTFNHSDTKDKFRIVMPFDRMMTKDEFYLKQAAIEARFPGVDRASYSVTQAIYFHSGADPKLAYSRHNKGVWLNVSDFKDKIPSPVKSKVIQTNSLSVDDTFADNYKQALMKSLSTCSGIHRADAIKLVTLCKSVGATFQEFQQLCVLTCDPDSCMHDEKVQKALWNDITGDRMTGEVRDEFIKKHHGLKVSMIRGNKVTDMARAILNKYRTPNNV